MSLSLYESEGNLVSPLSSHVSPMLFFLILSCSWYCLLVISVFDVPGHLSINRDASMKVMIDLSRWRRATALLIWHWELTVISRCSWDQEQMISWTASCTWRRRWGQDVSEGQNMHHTHNFPSSLRFCDERSIKVQIWSPLWLVGTHEIWCALPEMLPGSRELISCTITHGDNHCV